MKAQNPGIGLLTGVALFALAPAAQAQGVESTAAADATGASATETADTSGEIVVTAQKRAERIQDVPVSITAFTGEALERAQIGSATELARQAPNFRVSVLGKVDLQRSDIRSIDVDCVKKLAL